MLKRNGLSHPSRVAREPARRYEWPCPGDLLHMDVTHYARFTRPGHAVTGDRSSTAAEKRAKVGYEHAHAIVDDHSRLAYAELLDDERAATVTAFVTRAFAFFAEHGVEPKRLMTDNAWSYTLNRSHHGQGVGLRPALPLLSTPRRRTATLARLLQPAQTAQLARRPTPAQPRSQPVWAGHLAGLACLHGFRRVGTRTCIPRADSGRERPRRHASRVAASGS